LGSTKGQYKLINFGSGFDVEIWPNFGEEVCEIV